MTPAPMRSHGARSERALGWALALSVWAPLTAGVAVIMSRSTTQLADFVRRSVELIALFMSWWTFRLIRRREPGATERARLERRAQATVAFALLVSGVVMLGLAVSRWGRFEPGGNVTVGLAIALLAMIVNGWFWRHYGRLDRESHSPILTAQRALYGAKALVDLVVLLALGTVALAPHWAGTPHVDAIGSAAVAGYLLWSAVRAGRQARRG